MVALQVFLKRTHALVTHPRPKDLRHDGITKCIPPMAFSLAETKSCNYTVIVPALNGIIRFAIEIVTRDDIVVEKALRAKSKQVSNMLLSQVCSKNSRFHVIDSFGFSCTSCSAYNCKVTDLDDSGCGLLRLKVTAYTYTSKLVGFTMPLFIFSNIPDEGNIIHRVLEARERLILECGSIYQYQECPDPRFHPVRKVYNVHDRRTLCVRSDPLNTQESPLSEADRVLMTSENADAATTPISAHTKKNTFNAPAHRATENAANARQKDNFPPQVVSNNSLDSSHSSLVVTPIQCDPHHGAFDLASVTLIHSPEVFSIWSRQPPPNFRPAAGRLSSINGHLLDQVDVVSYLGVSAASSDSHSENLATAPVSFSPGESVGNGAATSVSSPYRDYRFTSTHNRRTPFEPKSLALSHASDETRSPPGATQSSATAMTSFCIDKAYDPTLAVSISAVMDGEITAAANSTPVSTYSQTTEYARRGRTNMDRQLPHLDSNGCE